MYEFPVRHRGLIRYEKRELSSETQHAPGLADLLRLHKISNMNCEAFIDRAALPWQSIQAALYQTNAPIVYRAAIAVACLKGHGKGMVDSEYPPFRSSAGHGSNRPAGAEAKLKNSVGYRDAEGGNGNAIRPLIDEPHRPSEQITAEPVWLS